MMFIGLLKRYQNVWNGKIDAFWLGSWSRRTLPLCYADDGYLGQ